MIRSTGTTGVLLAATLGSSMAFIDGAIVVLLIATALAIAASASAYLLLPGKDATES